MSNAEINQLNALEKAVEEQKEKFLGGLAVAADRAIDGGDMYFQHTEVAFMKELSSEEALLVRHIMDMAADRAATQYSGDNLVAEVIFRTPADVKSGYALDEGYENTIQASWALDRPRDPSRLYVV